MSLSTRQVVEVIIRVTGFQAKLVHTRVVNDKLGEAIFANMIGVDPEAFVRGIVEDMSSRTIYERGRMIEDETGFSQADDGWAHGFLGRGTYSTGDLAAAASRLLKYSRQLGAVATARLKAIEEGLKETILADSGATMSGAGWAVSPEQGVLILFDVNAKRLREDGRFPYSRGVQTPSGWQTHIPLAKVDDSLILSLSGLGKRKIADDIASRLPAIKAMAGQAQQVQEQRRQEEAGRPMAPDPRVKLVDPDTLRIPSPWDNNRSKQDQLFHALRNAGIAVQPDFKNNTLDISPEQAAEALPILRDRAPRVAAAVEALAASTPTVTVTPEEIANAKIVWRRMSHMLAPEAKGREPDYVKIAVMLQRVKPGQLEADLGPMGKFKLEKHGPTSADIMLAIKAPPGKWWETQQASYVRGLKKPFPPDFVTRVPLKETPAVARALDLHAPALALALRIGLLTDAQMRTCAELDVLSVVGHLGEIPDPGLRAQCEHLVARLRYPPDRDGRPQYPYADQLVGVCFAHFANYRCLIGDAPGIGKSLQAISVLKLDPAKLLPALVIAPASVVRNWTRIEIPKWAPEFPTQIIDGSRDLVDLRRAPIAAISYSALANNLERILRAGFKTVIFDESQSLKREAAGWTKAALNLGSQVQNVLLLSGTPMENKDPTELWTQLHIIDPLTFPSKKEFSAMFGGKGKRRVRLSLDDLEAHDMGFEFADRGDRSREEKLAELRDQLRCFMVRRLFSQVKRPGTQEQIHLPPLWTDLPKETRAAYKQVEHEFENWLCTNFKAKATDWAARQFFRVAASMVAAGATDTEAKKAALREVVKAANELKPDYSAAGALNKINALRMAVGIAKIPLMVDWIREWFDENPGEPVLFFVDNKPVIEALRQQLETGVLRGIPYGVIDGDTNLNRRIDYVEAFQRRQIDLLIGNLAMSTGLTLTASHNVTFGQRFWTPSKEEQMVGRAARTGQTEPTVVRFIMGSNTIDERLGEIVDEKRDIIEQIMGLDRAASGNAERIKQWDGDEHEESVANVVANAMIERLRAGGDGGCTVTEKDVSARIKELAKEAA